MPELHQVTIPDGQPYFSFYHNDVEYCIWVAINKEEGEPDESINIRLSEVKPFNNDYRAYDIEGMHQQTSNYYLNLKGGVLNVINNEFIPLVNDYLESQDGGSIGFPEDGYLEQLNWVVEKGLSYSNGKIILTL